MHDKESKEILRRKSFKENKLENIWNLNDANIIRSFFNWVANSFQLPIESESQVNILSNLYKTLRLTGSYYEDDFCKAAEWSNQLYLDWKQNSRMSIYIIEGELPYRGIYNNTYLFKGYAGEYTYFANTRHIYISANREPASSLADIYSNTTLLKCPFSKEDWNMIFLVSADIVQEKDKRIAELERMLEETKSKKRIDGDYYEDEESYGNVSDRDNLDKESRIEMNLEARNAAKDYLDSLEDYDCSGWDPNLGNGLVKGIIKFKGKLITVVVTSSIGRKLYLHPRLFSELMIDPDNLLLNYGYDRRIHRISFNDTFKDNKDVNLIFDTDIITPKEFAYLANRYMYSKRHASL